MESDCISMSPGHELVPVHGKRDMSLGHIDTFTFCIKITCMSWRLDGDCSCFHFPGTGTNSCSWLAWYVPGTYRHIYILYQYFPYVMAPAWRLIIFPWPWDMNKLLFMACVICPWDMSTYLHSVSTLPYVKAPWMEIDNISMSPEHELVPVLGIRDMSLGHIDTFTFYMKTHRMSWLLDGDWSYFHAPRTWISSCSWHAWYVPGTYRHICILYQYFPYVMAPGWRLIIFPCPGTWISFLT